MSNIDKTSLFMPDKKLNKELMFKVLKDMDDVLGSLSVDITFTIYGGAVMCMVHNSRRFTEDIDAMFKNFDILLPLIDSLSKKYNLPSDWFNSQIEDLKYTIKDENLLLMEGFKNMKVYYPCAEQMLAMKLHAARSKPKSDFDDALHLMHELKIYDEESLKSILYKYIYKDCVNSRSLTFIQDLVAKVNAR